MLGNAYIKENEIYLHYDEKNIGSRTGMIYPLGFHLANITWFDIDYIDKLYKSLINFILNPHDDFKDNTAFYNKLSDYIDEIDMYCCYLHFYTQALIKLMIDLPTKGADAIYSLISVVTNSLDKLYNLDEFCRNEDLTVTAYSAFSLYKQIGEKAVEIVINDLKQKRKILNLEFDYLTCEKENLNGLSPKQKLYVLDNKQKRENYTKSRLISQFMPNKIIPPNINTEVLLKDFMIQNDVDIVQMYNINTIDDLIKFELLCLVENDINIKKCGHCGNYFVPIGRCDTLYCNRINMGESKTCSEIGARVALKEKKSGNPVEKACDSLYQKFYSPVRHNRFSKSNFNKLSEEVADLRQMYSNNLENIDKFNIKIQALQDKYMPMVKYKVKRKK